LRISGGEYAPTGRCSLAIQRVSRKKGRFELGTNRVQLAKQNIEAFNKADWETFRGTLTPDSVYQELATQRRTQGADAFIELAKGWRKAFPDVKGTIGTAIEGDDKVVLEIVWDGTQSGELASAMGPIPPSYKRATTPAVQVVSFKGDKIAETKHYFDLMTLLVQIGAMPAPAAA
jgi:steroid delta-isomerase-like uncharacterized protein